MLAAHSGKAEEQLQAQSRLTDCTKVQHKRLNEWVVLHRAAPQQCKV
jgi:hypothetical protein